MEDVAKAALAYVIDVFIATGSQMFMLLGPGLLLALCMYYLSNVLRNQSVILFGHGFWVYFTAIGTVIHELGHVVFVILFGHTLKEVNLFGPDGDSLGYVHHNYNPENLYQVVGNFFIGVGPIILGSIVIFFSSIFLVGDEVFSPFREMVIDTSSINSAGSAWDLIQEIWANARQALGQLFQWSNLTDWQFYVFLYLVLAIGTHLKLSPSDIEGAWTGFVAIAFLVLMFNLVTLWIGDFASHYAALIGQSYSFFYTIMVFTMVLSLIFIMLFAILVVIKQAVRS